MTTKYTVQKEIFSNRLKKLMSDKNETTYSLGDVLNLSAATISRYADGKMSPKITTIYSMANYFKVNPVWLMGYNVSKKLEVKQEPSITDKEKELLSYYNQLNDLGKDEAIKRVSELSEIPKYCNVVELPSKKDAKEDRSYLEPFAAHNDYADNEEELELIKEDEKLFDTFD